MASGCFSFSVLCFFATFAYQRSCQCFFYRPSFESFRKSVHRQANPVCPRCRAHRFSAIFNEPIVAAIASLFFRHSPPAITRFVIAVVANAVERIAFAGTLAHVGKESGERCYPLLTYRYASSSPIGITSVFLVGASIYHGCPGRKLRRVSATVDQSVFVSDKMLTRHGLLHKSGSSSECLGALQRALALAL